MQAVQWNALLFIYTLMLLQYVDNYFVYVISDLISSRTRLNIFVTMRQFRRGRD